jgi:hypothetical protein
MRVQVAHKIMAHIGAGEDARARTVVVRGRIPCVLKGADGILKDQPMLGIHQPGFPGGNPEELGIEQIVPFDGIPVGHIARLLTEVHVQPGGQLAVRNARAADASPHQVLPKARQGIRPRNPQRHSDNGDTLLLALMMAACRHCELLSCCHIGVGR